jgi:hypothetical protein
MVIVLQPIHQKAAETSAEYFSFYDNFFSARPEIV